MNIPDLRDALTPFVAPEHIQNVVELFDRYTAPAVRANHVQVVNALDDLRQGLMGAADGDPADEKHYRWGEQHGIDLAIKAARGCKP